jgi:hypothetical protein
MAVKHIALLVKILNLITGYSCRHTESDSLS